MATQKDWDDAYANMAHIEGSEQLPDQWSKRALRYRQTLDKGNLDTDVSYGKAAREVWMRLDKSYWTDLAEGARAQGWIVCMPSYTLTPEVTISHITKQIASAINKAAKHFKGPIRLAGHSAGGHLVSRMICQDTGLQKSTLQRIEHTLSISGLHDLRPLMQTKMNDVLQLSETEAQSESPALLRPADNQLFTSWVGGYERPEFIRQSKLIANVWEGLGANTNCVVDGEHHHFSVIEDLKSADSPITNAFVGNR